MDKKKVLNDIITRTRTAKEHLRIASKEAKSVGDNSGSAELDKVANDVEKTEKKFDNIREGKNS